MNPFTIASNSGLLGAMSRGLIKGIGRQRKLTKSRIREKSNKVKRRRMRNKMAYKSRRKNRILMKGK